MPLADSWRGIVDRVARFVRSAAPDFGHEMRTWSRSGQGRGPEHVAFLTWEVPQRGAPHFQGGAGCLLRFRYRAWLSGAGVYQS